MSRPAHPSEYSKQAVIIQLYADALSHHPELLCANLHQQVCCWSDRCMQVRCGH